MSDRRAVVLLLVLGVVGAIVRFFVPGNTPTGGVAFHPSSVSAGLLAHDSSGLRAGRLVRRLRPGETVDFDTAGSEQMARVPRLGRGLALKIVRDREEHGPFGTVEALRRVGGMGSVLLEAVRPYATFSGVPSGSRVGGPSADPRPSAPVLRSDELSILRSAGPSLAVSLNTASAAELAQLPGIGWKTAYTIVADRAQHGPFRTVDDLMRVPGVGRGMTERLRGQVQVSP